ncbi:hypothetical protein BH11ARM2_BH11ARM2_35690 [soil metagenome]
MLAPSDVLVLFKIITKRGHPWTQPELASELSISQSMVSRALKTAASLNLYHPSSKLVNARQLKDALVHGSRYFLTAKRGGEVRGMRTAWAAPPLLGELATNEPLPPVWPDAMGDTRGLLLEPLHPSVPKAARLDPQLYELLAILDVLRVGGARERRLAEKALHERFDAR